MEQIKTKLNQAWELTKDVDASVRLIAFELTYAHLLQLNNQPQTSHAQETKPSISKLANACELEPNQVAEAFDIDEEKKTVNILLELSGSEPEKQVMATQLYLLAKTHVFGETTIFSKDLVVILKNLGISVDNLARSLKNNNQLFVFTDNGPSSNYKITTPGLIRAKELLKKLLSDTHAK